MSTRMALPFSQQCKLAGLPEPQPEYRFAPPRRWRADWCWVEQKVILEVQGGLFVGGRHSRGAALLKEHEKLNVAAALGYRVLFVTPSQVNSGEALTAVERALRSPRISER